MRWMRKWLSGSRRDQDLRDELAAHLEIEKAQRRDMGQSPDEAEREARKIFGNVVGIGEQVREEWGWAGLERFVQDFRFGVRLLLRARGWSAVVCLTLALGIGMSTAIFSVVHAVLLQPLPYADPDRIVSLNALTPDANRERLNPNPMLWMHWRQHMKTVEDLALTRQVANFNLTGDGAPERLQGGRISFNLPRVLGVGPLLGREFTEEEQLTNARVVLLTHALWVRRFGGDPSIVGRKVQLNGEPFEVVGVMPPRFRYPNASFELWSPLYLPPTDVGHGRNYGMLCVGRLRPGETVERAQAELNTIMSALAKDHPAAYHVAGRTMGTSIRPLADSQAEAIRPTLLMLSAAVVCLLVIGCMNLGVLLIAKASGRSREILVRVALGAGAGRLRRQLLAEAIPLGAVGGLAGILLAHWMLELLVPMLPPEFPRTETIALNGAAVAFAVACSLGIVFLASLFPARGASVVQLSESLQQNSRAVAGGATVRNFLVIGQVAVAMLLLFGGLLFARSFSALLSVQPGFRQEGLLTMHIAASRAKFPENAQIAEYYKRLTERIRNIPGVLDAGFVNRLPLTRLGQTGGLEFEGKEMISMGSAMFMVDWRSATPGYFQAMGIPLVRGRYITDQDGAAAPRVGLIDTQLAKRVFGDENPVGKRFRQSIGPGQPNDEPWSEIVGVVGHVLHDSLEKDARPQAYWPQAQRVQERGALVVRTSGAPRDYANAVVAQIRAENPDQPVYDIRTMEDWVARSMQTRTVTTSLVFLFGFSSVVLACLGLYGVVSYAAGLRLREFGIRLALGSTAAEVRALVLRQASRIIGAGVLLGLTLCAAAAQALRGFLFGVGGFDPVSWIAAPVLLMCVGLLAGLGPAMRAARVDPAQTLRADV